MCNILFVAYYYLFVVYNLCVRRKQLLFVFLKYLFPVTEFNYLVLKKLKNIVQTWAKCDLILKILL